MRSFYTETWTRRRAPLATDAHGNLAPNWAGTLDTLTVENCRRQPLSTEEMMDNRYESDVRNRLFAPYGSDITYLDRMVSPTGVVYEVAAQPESYNSPTGAAQHDEVMLRVVTG